ncbi:hypothetical protein [Xenophilus sp. Marseille-Q4582]|uniref:hypothetical protein n=1 Tax=Xenophilus sp. Marseille-Q4582 TaxID=2866600 RepID=UPI001CE46223|nr:hypothetical protein [Xenophilus sp. Marseille-Q4582]
MKAAPSARSWIAAGVRHELLMRAMPAVRHDLAAPLSLMRMQLLMLRRQAQADVPAQPQAIAPRVAQLEAEVSELSQGIRSLREWEWPAPESGAPADLTRSALVAQAVSLMRAAFELNGIVLQVAPGLEPQAEGNEGRDAPEPPRWSDAVGLRYLLIGGLCHLHDSHDALDSGGCIALTPVEDWGVRLEAAARPAGQAPGEAPAAFAPHRAPRHLAIDAISLQALAEDLGHAVTLAPEALTLDLRRS